MKINYGRAIIAGLLGGFIGNGALGALFSTPVIKSILYNPALQILNLLELAILLTSSLIEGLVISFIVERKTLSPA